MRRSYALVFLCVMSAFLAQGQDPAQSLKAQPVLTGDAVPRLMKFSGTLKDRSGKALNGIVAVNFLVYKEQDGGSALWMETQNVQADAAGNYSVMIGAGSAKGLPLDLFLPGEARWLSTQLVAPDEEEQVRVQLVSVPFALKASDADTLGGKPLSAFMLAPTVNGVPSSGSETPADRRTPAVVRTSPAVSGTGTINSVPKWSDTNGGLIDSSIHESGGNVGIGTTNPGAPLDVTNSTNLDMSTTDELQMHVPFGTNAATVSNAGGKWGLSFIGYTDNTFGQQKRSSVFAVSEDSSAGYTRSTGLAFYTSSLDTNQAERMRIDHLGNVGIGTANPGSAYKLDVAGIVNAQAIYQNGAPLSTSQWTSNGGSISFLNGINGNVSIGGNLVLAGSAGTSGIMFPDGTLQKSACGALSFGAAPQSVKVKLGEIHVVNTGGSCSYTVDPTTLQSLLDTMNQLQSDGTTMKHGMQDLQGQIDVLRRLIGGKAQQ